MHLTRQSALCTLTGMVEKIDIKAIRQALNITPTELGERVGVHRTTACRWENGITVPRGPARKALLALKAEADALMQKREAA